MIDASDLIAELRHIGIREFAGVPCSYLTPLINRIASGPTSGYIRVTQEGEALAFAAGAWLAGATTAVIAQNSGLGNMVNPLTSLTHPAQIPVPLIITWRGEPGRPDEPQHQLLGAIMLDLLELMRVGHAVLPPDLGAARRVLAGAQAAMDTSQLPYALILRQGVLADEPISERPPPVPVAARTTRPAGLPGPRPSRTDGLDCLLSCVTEDTAVISTTGHTSRELFTLADRPQHFYLVGAMGLAAALGLGVARHTRRTVVVIDGDGAALMRLGVFAVIGAYPAANFVHVLLDNQVHGSTGGQFTLSAQVQWGAIAAACGYAQVHECADLAGFSDAMTAAQAGGGPALVHLPIQPGSPTGLGRPAVGPATVARRFREFVTGAAR
jgi:phosphonopyruvate decarboxylase